MVLRRGRRGVRRRDDAATTNLGPAEYSAATLSSSLFVATGSTFYNSVISLPFGFPFYDGTYTNVSISTDGYLQLGTDDVSNQGSVNQQFAYNRRIAPLWHAGLIQPIVFTDTSVSGR